MSELTEKPQFETTQPKFERYANEFTTPENELLTELSRQTHFASTVPGMLSGHLQGQLLRFFSLMMKPQKILEIGTFTGYSAICLAAGLAENGKIISIDNNPELTHLAAEYIEKAGLKDKTELLCGDAAELIHEVQGPFDLVFIDADKENYTLYYEAVFPKVKTGGFIIADNVLWYGKVMEEDALTDKETRGIAAFNNLVKSDPRVEQLLLPVRDGLMIIRKCSE
jgi:predicted O-methyltransferase YrrM